MALSSWIYSPLDALDALYNSVFGGADQTARSQPIPSPYVSPNSPASGGALAPFRTVPILGALKPADQTMVLVAGAAALAFWWIARKHG